MYLVVLPGNLTKRGKMDDREELDAYTQFSNLVDFVMERIKHIFNAGIEVWDAHNEKFTTIQLVLVGNLEDGQGLSRVVGCKSNTSGKGACPLCKKESFRFLKSQYFLGCVNNLPIGHIEKQLWMSEFAGVPLLSSIAQMPPDEKCTTSFAREEQRSFAANPNEINKKNCFFPYENVFARHINRLVI